MAMSKRPCGLLTLVVVLSIGATAVAADDPAGIEFFEKNIRPVLVSKCYSCHSAKAKKLKGGLLLDTREATRRGGESGHAVVPGNLEDSLLIESIRYEGLEMPPKEQLPAAVIAKFEKWVKMGAPDPRGGKTDPAPRVIDFDEARKFWSFQPIADPKPPKVADGKWAESDIDRFVLARLEAKDLKPVADADLRTLVRRTYFDLIGLPPTPKQVDEFVSDPSPAAFAKLVDRLLESPQFGERWGRHWLDVVRYGESTGMERNYSYPHAWRYRDYVIESFNADKPFNRFLTEQVAGDLMPAESTSQRHAQTIATGLLAIGTKSLNERNREKFAMDIVDDQIDVTTRAFLGLTGACARCHDHKFDPIPTKEYYALAGIFRSTATYYGTGSNRGNRQQGQLLALAADGVRPVASKGGGAKKNNAANKKAANQLRAARKRLQKFNKQAGDDPNANQAALIKRTTAQIKRLQKLAKPQKAGKKPAAPVGKNVGLAMGVADGNPSDTQIRIRGNADERGETVPRGFLTIATLGDAPKIGDAASGRLELAEWMTQDSNPLTARVAVNRAWQHLFGRGIVRTVNNFGKNGERPTHPELLDHLASRFVENNWSVKRLVRSIVMSHSYRLGSRPNAAAEKVDPENQLLWRANHRRLEAEAIRDAILAASGQLDRAPGDKSVVATVGDGDIGRSIQPARFAVDSVKRSVYLPIVRSAVPEALRVFDFPEPSIISGQRDVTTVPTQALFMMNSEFVLQQSRHMATRVISGAETNSDRVTLAYRLTLCREPSKAEIQRAVEFIEQTSAQAEETEVKDNMKAWSGFCQVLVASAEFRYIE